MGIGGAYRPFLHQRHFRAACSFEIAVVRAHERTSANQFKDGHSARPVDGDLTAPSAPKRAAAVGGAPSVAEWGRSHQINQ